MFQRIHSDGNPLCGRFVPENPDSPEPSSAGSSHDSDDHTIMGAGLQSNSNESELEYLLAGFGTLPWQVPSFDWVNGNRFRVLAPNQGNISDMSMILEHIQTAILARAQLQGTATFGLPEVARHKDEESLFHLYNIVETLIDQLAIMRQANLECSIQEPYCTHFHEFSKRLGFESATTHFALTVLGPASLDKIKLSLFCVLSDLHCEAYKQQRAVEDNVAAISYVDEALHYAHDDKRKSRCLFKLSMLHSIQFLRTEDADYLDAALDCCEESLSLIPNNDPDRPQLLDGLCNLRQEHYRRTAFGDSINTIPPSFEQKPELKHGLQSLIELREELVRITPQNDPSRPQRLYSLARLLHIVHFESGDVAQLERNVSVYHDALELILDEDIEKTSCMIELGALYLNWYVLTGRHEHLEKAMKTQAAALLRAPLDHSTRPLCLNALGSCHRIRYRRTGEIADIDTAIAYHTQAVTSICGASSDIESACLQGLSTALLTRFQRLGDISDLDRSFEHCASATQLTPRGHNQRFVNLMQLGFSYRTRYKLFKKSEDIDAAIDCLTEAVSLAPTGRLAEMLNHLGSLHRHRFLQFNQPSDIQTAIELHTKSVSLTVSDDPNQSGRLTNLSTALFARFNSLAQPDDINLAIKRQHEAISKMPEGHPENSTMMHELGAIYASRSWHFKDEASLMSARHWFELAAVHVLGQPQLQIEAALKWARINRSLSTPQYIDAFGRALELMPQFAWLGCAMGQRYERIATFSEIPIEAAAAAIELNRPDLALEWLEQGRSIVWTQILGLRTPIDDLREVNPNLADKIESVARRLGSGVAQDSATESGPVSRLRFEEEASEYRSLVSSWESLLRQVRELQGFNRFLLPNKVSALLESAKNSVIIMINIDRTRCDALALQPGRPDVMHIPLPDFSYSQCSQMRNQMLEILQGTGIRARNNRKPRYGFSSGDDTLENILASLWLALVRPVLDALGYLVVSDSTELPRVTWCTTGPLAFLPLHAAGLYHSSKERIYQYVVSSYVPSLSTIINHQPKHNEEFNGVLVVGQAAQTGCSLLPGTVVELKMLREKTKCLESVYLDEEYATPKAVLSAMQKTSWVHLACHASQHLSDPTASAFQLHGGTLSLADMILHLRHGADLAFLSACETATGDSKVPDEAVHLAAGMLISGYRTVIGTMWSIKDVDAPLVSEYFYSKMLEDGIPDNGNAARALHHAVSKLRDTIGEREFLRWIPYIHLGM
ncbi:CHAT domain protein [Ceratobasidium sp. AG-Ba]|nr:CHAT domain protein [Ceratobasidium sp. AG-Ba]